MIAPPTGRTIGTAAEIRPMASLAMVVIAVVKAVVRVCIAVCAPPSMITPFSDEKPTLPKAKETIEAPYDQRNEIADDARSHAPDEGILHVADYLGRSALWYEG